MQLERLVLLDDSNDLDDYSLDACKLVPDHFDLSLPVLVLSESLVAFG